MKKIGILFILLLLPFRVWAVELTDLLSPTVLLYDPGKEEIMYEKGSDNVINIASLTKIMTTIVAIENIPNLDDKVLITDSMLAEIPSDASVAGLKVGDEVSYLDLLYASILPSGADATTALAHSIAGSTEGFVNLMNEKAQSLGLENTHFANVTGYDIDNHHSTAKEVLKILLYSLKNDLFNKIYRTKEYTLSNGLVVKTTLDYYNPSGMYDLSKIVGSKTGYTDDAGLCMSSIINIDGKELILITLGAQRDLTSPDNIDDALSVISYLNHNYKNVVLFEKGATFLELPVKYSNINTYEVKASEDITYFTDDYDNTNIKYHFDGVDNLSFKNKKGDKIGTINITYQGQEFSQDVFLDTDIKISLGKYLFTSPICIIIYSAIVILLSLGIFGLKKHKRKHHYKHA